MLAPTGIATTGPDEQISRTVILDGPWPLRVVWLALPFALGPALGQALDPASEGVQLVAVVLAWSVWTVGVVASLVPRTLGLTYLRIAGPAAFVVGVWASLRSDDALVAAMAAAIATATLVVVLMPTTGDLFVNGSAYGDERRFALRAPAALLFGPVQVVWALVVVGTITGPLLLADGRWLLGGLLTVAGIPVAGLGCRSLHQLSRRWLVLVPAGVVVHDPTVVVAQLFRRRDIGVLRPAPADTGALDLTSGAPGLALEIQLREAATLELRQRGQARPRVVHATAVIVTPTRPGAVLQEAARRSIPVS
jgi:hypothetical protein